MLLDVLINYCALKELLCQDKGKKLKPKLNHKNVRSGNSANYV